MAKVKQLIAERRMDMFLDLHNPAPGDPTFFYILDNSLHPAATIALRDRFIELAYGRISKIKPLIPMSNKPKTTGPNYHPLWKQISANWVCMNGNPQTVSVCLETIWNYKNCTTEGYRAVGANIAAAVREFLAERVLVAHADRYGGAGDRKRLWAVGASREVRQRDLQLAHYPAHAGRHELAERHQVRLAVILLGRVA